MKKIFFVFAMLLMSITSALAKESSEYFAASATGTLSNPCYQREHITVSGQLVDGSGMYISRGNRVSIKANDGKIITKVEFTVGYGQGTVETTAGIVRNNPVSKKDVDEIYDVNESYLEIFSSVVNDFQIRRITVYYEPGNNGNNNGGNNDGSNENSSTFVMDEYVQTESFSIYGLTFYQGRNVKITGSGNGDGYDIANGVKITADAHVKILKVDFGLNGSNNDSPIESTPGVVEGSDKNWTINNVNSSNLTISNSGTGNVKINSIKVYYVELSEEKTEYFDVAKVYNCSGNSVTINGTENTNYDMELADGNSVTITANSGVDISKLDLCFAYYRSNPLKTINSTAGIVNGTPGELEGWSITDINSPSLTLSHPGLGGDNEVQIGGITVYYREKIAPTTIEVTAKEVDGACWTTFYSNASNYKAPEGTQVFKVKLSGVDITMTEIVDRIVTKGQGVVLKSTNSNIEMIKTDSVSSDGYSGNCLLGTSVSITNPGNAYVLSYNPSNGVGFYKLSSTGTIGINKAYLVYNGAASARTFFAFDGAATGIEMNNVGGNEGNDKVYDLQGRRVANPSNGIYIVNGKKVIMNRR